MACCVTRWTPRRWPAIWETLCDRKLRDRIGAAGRETVRPLTLTHMADQLMALYRELLPIAEA